jgi:hypothetical protein
VTLWTSNVAAGVLPGNLPKIQSQNCSHRSTRCAQAGWFLHIGPVLWDHLAHQSATGLCARFGGLGCFTEDLAKQVWRTQPSTSTNNSHAQANSGFCLIRSYIIWLLLEEASPRTYY